MSKPHIFVIEDDQLMAECLCRAYPAAQYQIFHDAISAMAAFDTTLPNLILLDVLLNGPDGFTFLNELASYTDTACIPIIVVTSLNLSASELSPYGVQAVLSKETMTPAALQAAIHQALTQPSKP